MSVPIPLRYLTIILTDFLTEVLPENQADHPGLYASHMGEGGQLVTTGMETARTKLREFVDAAAETGQRTVIERHGRPVAVLVSVHDASALMALDADPELREELVKRGKFPPPRAT